MKKILIVGAGGQIGSELVPYLRSIYGADNVIATDVRECKGLADEGPFEVLDAQSNKYGIGGCASPHRHNLQSCGPTLSRR